MLHLKGKRGLIMGVANERSIAWGIAKAMSDSGAKLAFTYQGETFGKRLQPLAETVGANLMLDVDVTDDASLDRAFEQLQSSWGSLDFVVHAIAYSEKNELTGRFMNTTRENFKIAHDVSSYSFTALAKEALPYLNNNASLLTVSYLGAERTMPNYNVMGLAKASLEANVRYMSHSLGNKGIRVNAVSAGPIKTLAASGIANFDKMIGYNEKHAALKRNVTIDEVGNAAAFLCSDLASGITGEITYVDGGMNITAAGIIE